MASLCKSQQCCIERRGFRQELDSWRHKLIHCVGFESILEGLFGPGLLKDLSLFEDCEPTSVCDWSFDENCLFCCVRREKVKEHLAGFHKPVCEAGQENLLKQEQAKIIRLERQAEEFINAVFYKKDSPRVFDPNIPLVAREIMQRMIRQFAAEYTSKTSSTQDSSHPNSTKNQSLPKSPSGKSSPPPATTQNPVLSKLLMADQDSPLDLTVKKSPSEEPCEQADGVLDLSTKKSPCSGSTSSSISQSTSNTIGNGICHTGKKATDGANSAAVTLKKFMVKLCAHHQEQFAQVLNSLCTEEQFTLSEKNTPISDDQRNGCTCFEAKAKALPLLDSRASTATPQDPVITKVEANSANEIEHHGQLVDCSPGLFPRSPIPVETSAEDCMTPKNYSVVSKIVYSKEDGKQSIKSEDSSLRLEDCSAVSHEKGININAKVQGSAPCADALRDQEHLLDPLDGGIIDLHGGSSPSIEASKAIDRLKESVASTILPFQDQENGLVSAAQKTLLQETRPCLTSTAPFVVNCDEPSGAFTIGRPIHEYRTDVPFPKCESVSKASVEVVSIAQLEETDLERKPSKRSLESCTEYIAHTIINGTSTHCPLSYAVINTANGHNEMVITPSNVLDVENKDVFSSEVQVQEDGTADPAVNARFGVDLVSCKTEPVSPSLDVDLNLFVETKSTIDVCETATTEFHCEQNPLRIPSEKPLVLVDSSVRLPTPVFLQTNGIDEQIVHCPICQSNLKKSDTQVHSETCIVVQNLKTEDVEMTISSLGDINTNDYPGGNSSELSKPKCTQALKPLHSKLNCNATHSVNRATSEEILVNLRSRSCIEGFHAEMPTENNLHSCPLETDIKCVLVKPGSSAPQQEMLKCTKQFDNSEGNCVISSIKDNLNIEAALERSAEIGKNAPSYQTEKLNRSTLASLDHELVENLPVACIKVEENITFINQGFDCSEYKIIPNIQMYARTKPLSKKFSALIPSDRRLRSHVFNEPPILIPQTQAPKCIGNKIVNAVTYGETADSLSACEDNKNVLRIRKAVGNTKSASDENDTHQSSNSMRTKNKPVVSKALFIKQEDDEPLDKTVCQERKYYLNLRNRHCVPDVLSKDICHNASILESSTFNQEAQNKYFSRQSLITKKHTHSKPANKPKRLDSENYNLRTSIAHTKPKRVTKTANCINIASIKSEETFSGLELNSPANETRRPKFVDWCSEEDNQELISSFSSKYMSVHKTWIPLEKEGTVTHKAKNRADKLKEIWKTKKRTRKNRSGLEAPRYSPIQSLFMTSVHFSDLCQWFVETTETKSLVIVKKLNTRLPGDLELPSFPLHKYPASSLYPHMLQAQRLKKYLKKFASVTPARNDQKLQTTLTKLKEGGDLNLHENLSDNDIVQGTNACRAGKSKGNVSKPVTDQILPKYNNCKGVSHLISAVVKPEKKEHPINAMETKISCSNTSTRMSFSRSASEVGNDLRSSESLTTEKRHRGRKRPKDSSGKSETQVVKKKRMKTPTSTRNILMIKNGNKKAVSKSRGLKKQTPKHATPKTHKTSALKKRMMKRKNSSKKRAQVVKKHKMKTRQSKSSKQKLSAKPVITKIVKKALRVQRTRPKEKSPSGPAKYKKRVKHQLKTKTRSKTDCPTRIKRRSLEVK